MSIFGFACMWIFFRHIFFFDLKSYGFFDYFSQLGDCGVDIFLFLSGYGCYYSFKKDENVEKFYIKRVIRILPSVILLLPIFALIVCWRNDNSFFLIINPRYYIMSIYSSFWYIGAIIVFYLLFPLFYRWNKKKCSTFFVALLVAFVGIFLVHQIGSSLLDPLVLYFARCPVFILGMLFAKNNNLFNYKKTIALITIAILPLLFVIPKDYQRIGYISLALTSVTFLPYCFEKIPQTINKLFTIIGIASLEFYMIHVFVFAKGFEKKLLEFDPFGGGGTLVLLILISVIFQKVINIIQDCLNLHTKSLMLQQRNRKDVSKSI